MKKTEVVRELLKRVPGRFSKELGLDLENKNKLELFKWFLASILFGARISETIAKNTYRKFAKHEIDSPNKITNVGWDGLVKLLDDGGYVRYDFKTATKLLDIASQLENEYQGDLNLLHAKARTSEELEHLLYRFKGIGPVTINIFLRELRDIWKRADPPLGNLTLQAASDLGLLAEAETRDPRKSLEILREIWRETKVKGKKFADFESALVRLGKNYCRKNKEKCPLREYHFTTYR